MATRTSKTATATKSTGRRTGRPTNIERNARLRSQADQMVNLLGASYAQGLRDALSIEGGVQTLSALASAAPSIQQGSQSQPATSQPAATTTTRKTKKAPGRRVEPDSNMSKTRRFYAENLASANPLNRADFVREAAKRFDYTPQTANTYVSNIEREGGYKLVRRGGATRGRSNGTSKTAAAA